MRTERVGRAIGLKHEVETAAPVMIITVRWRGRQYFTGTVTPSVSLAQMTKRLASTIKPRRLTSDRAFDLSSALFRKSATKCTELAQSAASREQRELFLKMTRMWEELAQNLGKRQLVREDILRLEIIYANGRN